MAFDDVTLFELHIDGAQFGPGESPGAERTSEGARDAEPERSGGRGRALALVALSIGVSLVVATAARRIAGDGERLEIEALGDVEAVPVR